MGSAASHTYRVPEFTDLQHPHNEVIIHAERKRSRRNTMEAVLKYHRQEVTDGVDYLMTAYEQWLLTAKKTNMFGHPMNRWDLMTAFVETQLIV
jgi:hypothetical protein